MVKALEILSHCLSCLLLAVTASSCASTDDPLTDNGQDNETISFKFTIYTAENPSSPASASATSEENAADIAERILNIEDMRILLFDQSGVLLKSTAPAYLDYNGSDESNDGYYTLSTAFTHDYFDKFDDNDNIPFTVMILANLNGIGGRYTDYRPGNTRIADIMDSFIMPAEYFPSQSTGIPMYGIKGFVIPKGLLTQGIDAPAAGQIDLIRSLCKIEVNDKIANATDYPTGERYPKVVAVEMISWANHGYIRPAFDDYPQGLSYANIYPAPPTDATVTATRVNNTFRFYCPEAKTSDMRFRIWAVLSPGEKTRSYEIGLGDFSSEIGNELVRNHIYRFDVHALNTIAGLSVNVSDWNRLTNEFELDNIVSVEPDGFMKWDYNQADFAVTTELYNGQEEEQLSILNGTADHASGTFHILSPKGATWKAYFIPGENGVDAFEFIDVDNAGNAVPGSQRVYTEGDVGTPATIHVRGKGAADSYRHWAELVIEVKTVDGTILYAPLTPSMSSRFIIYRENKL